MLQLPSVVRSLLVVAVVFVISACDVADEASSADQGASPATASTEPAVPTESSAEPVIDLRDRLRSWADEQLEGASEDEVFLEEEEIPLLRLSPT